jgi:aminopeptidase N
VVAGPGLLQGVAKKGGQAIYHWKTNYTINNYCIVFNIGKFKLVERPYTTIEGNKVPMQFYVLEAHEAKAARLLELLEKSCRIHEKYFGEYPWVNEKIGLCETPHLGMEHQTLIAYGNKFNYIKVNGQDFDWLMHHEFGHEWWANKVSNKDWAHIWIQEGICSFGDALYYREVAGEAAYLNKMRTNAAKAANDKPIVQGEEVNSDDAYIGDIYGKGAFFIHSLRCVMGDSLLFAAVKRLATDKQYTYDNMVTTDDVERLFSQIAGKKLKPYFDLFLRTTDQLKIAVTKVADGEYRVQLQNLDMPLPLDITTHDGVKRYIVTAAGTTIKSQIKPVIDANSFYMKQVKYE